MLIGARFLVKHCNVKVVDSGGNGFYVEFLVNQRLPPKDQMGPTHNMVVQTKLKFTLSVIDKKKKSLDHY